jgi:hypothetical protein
MNGTGSGPFSIARFVLSGNEPSGPQPEVWCPSHTESEVTW